MRGHLRATTLHGETHYFQVIENDTGGYDLQVWDETGHVRQTLTGDQIIDLFGEIYDLLVSLDGVVLTREAGGHAFDALDQEK